MVGGGGAADLNSGQVLFFVDSHHNETPGVLTVARLWLSRAEIAKKKGLSSHYEYA